jgi:3-dehydroquinate synthase
MARLQVNLPDTAYPIDIARSAFARITVPHTQVALVADEAVALLHAGAVTAALEAAGARVTTITVPSGERCKTLEVLGSALSRLAAQGFTRDSAVVALGGGATSDLAGFVAAAFLRGIAFYVLPTTLLAMVDASVGGKTGVNLPEGKNLVGAFHQPRGVWADLATLETLPARTFREGAAEIFKHGLLTNGALCDAVLEPGFGVRSDRLEAVVADAVQVKIDFVQRDPFEAGARAFLNFGHTLAHALEAVTLHALPHGEAVGYGMHFAALVGKRLGLEDLTARTRAFLEYQRPAKLEGVAWRELLTFMNRDKKADARGLRFVLLERLGAPRLERVPDAALEEAWKAFENEVVHQA